jgi:hypothetical protein
MPRSALASLPEMSHEILVGEDSPSCSNVTVPLTLESPRRTATTHDCQPQCPVPFLVSSYFLVQKTGKSVWSVQAIMLRKRERGKLQRLSGSSRDRSRRHAPIHHCPQTSVRKPIKPLPAYRNTHKPCNGQQCAQSLSTGRPASPITSKASPELERRLTSFDHCDGFVYISEGLGDVACLREV